MARHTFAGVIWAVAFLCGLMFELSGPGVRGAEVLAYGVLIFIFWAGPAGLFAFATNYVAKWLRWGIFVPLGLGALVLKHTAFLWSWLALAVLFAAAVHQFVLQLTSER